MSFPLFKNLPLVSMASEYTPKIQGPSQSDLRSQSPFSSPASSLLHQASSYYTKHAIPGSSIPLLNLLHPHLSRTRSNVTIKQKALSHSFLNVPLSEPKVIPSFSLLLRNVVLILPFSSYSILPNVAIGGSPNSPTQTGYSIHVCHN